MLRLMAEDETLRGDAQRSHAVEKPRLSLFEAKRLYLGEVGFFLAFKDLQGRVKGKRLSTVVRSPHSSDSSWQTSS